MKKVLFITPDDAEPGFRLSGAMQETASKENVGLLVLKAVNEPGTGLIAIDERLLAGTRELLKDLEKKWKGIVVTLPAPELPGIKAEDYALALIRRAVGYHVRLKL